MSLVAARRAPLDHAAALGDHPIGPAAMAFA
jgi:hypothetical protein